MAVVRRRSSLPQAPHYTIEHIEALCRDHNEPGWLRERRLEAWAQYKALPMPYMEEEWRRTDYRHIRWDEADQLDQSQRREF